MFIDYWLPLLLNWLVATSILFISFYQLPKFSLSNPISAIRHERRYIIFVCVLYLFLCFIPLLVYPPEFWAWLLH